MATISRRVKELSKDGQPVNPDKDRSIEDLRAIPAWVLLGEPGAGKSQTFAEEARACQGVHISVAEFLYLEAEEQWGGRILFLDGLDEIRASNDSQSILLRLRARLKKLGTPAYRIACRAADWYGTLDEDDIRPASPNGILSIFCLLPLDENDAARILQEDFEVGEPSTFIATARFHGVDGMLQNPHTLKLLAQAITANALPSTREEVFELACRSQVMEVGKRHRVQAQSPSAMPDALLDAAGQLFAVMLLSDKSGIALDSEAGDARYPSLESFQPPDINHAQTVLHRPLLVPSLSRSDCLEPSHRSVAEFLAARWLAKQIDVQGLPVGRALNLLLGFDGKTIAGLRGLYAWLALRCHAARATLNEMDPLTVVLYGDVGPMPLADKRQLLRGLLREVRQPVTLREVRSAPSVRALFDSGLEPDFLEILESTQRDDSSQVSLEVVLAVLNGAPLSSMLTDCLKTVAIDRSRWQRVRIRALQEWIDNQDSQVKVLGFLDEIRAGSISDADDELSGLLLRHLYPVALTAETLFDYLHTPQTPNLLGNYTNFWAYEFPKLATNDDLPILLDKLAMRTDLGLGGHTEFHLNGMAGELVVRAVSVHGDAISDERLFTWLSIGSNEYGENRRSRQLQEVLTKWLGERPQRYKGLLAVSYSACANSEDPLRCLFSKRHALSGATVPDDIGLWHLQQAGVVANPVLAREHMRNAVRTLMTLRGNKQLTLEKVIEWAGSDTVRNEWLQSELYCEISTMQQTWAQSQLQYNQEQAELRHKRTSYLADHLQDIADGSAPAAWLGELAGVWNNRFSNTRGETPLDRFMAYCDNYEEVYEAVNSGFRACVKRADIPSIEAIIEQYLSQKTFFNYLPMHHIFRP